MLQMKFILILYFENLFLRNCLLYEADTLHSMFLALTSTKKLFFSSSKKRTLVAMATTVCRDL